MTRSIIAYDGKEIGVVGFVRMESFECSGTIALTAYGETFQPLWSHIEHNGIDNIPFSDDLMDDLRWTFVTDGQQRGIYFPMVLEDGSVSWRWR